MIELKNEKIAIPVVLFAGILWSFGPLVVRYMNDPQLFKQSLLVFRCKTNLWQKSYITYNLNSISGLFLQLSSIFGGFEQKFDRNINLLSNSLGIKIGFMILHHFSLTKLCRCNWGLLQLSKPELSLTYW